MVCGLPVDVNRKVPLSFVGGKHGPGGTLSASYHQDSGIAKARNMAMLNCSCDGSHIRRYLHSSGCQYLLRLDNMSFKSA